MEPLATLTSKMNSGKAEHFKTGGCGLKPGRKKTGREFNQKLPGKSRFTLVRFTTSEKNMICVKDTFYEAYK